MELGVRTLCAEIDGRWSVLYQYVLHCLPDLYEPRRTPCILACTTVSSERGRCPTHARQKVCLPHTHCVSHHHLSLPLRAKSRVHMPFSHHSHSGQFCKHAAGTLEDVVREAIRQGFRTYGLTEHVPRHRVDDLYPEEVLLQA